MSQIFISYKREDRAFAQKLSAALEASGFEVWYDFELISGDQYRSVIRNVIDECAVAIVVWSAKAVESDFVLDEATHAKGKGKLCPVRIDDAVLPLGFGQMHVDNLSEWDGELTDPEFQRLLSALIARTGAQSSGARFDAEKRNRSRQEIQDFTRAQTQRTDAALRAFLAKYPEGSFAKVVRDQIRESQRWGNRFGRLPLAVRSFVIGCSVVALAGGLYELIDSSIEMKTNQLTGSAIPEPLTEAQLAFLVRRSLELVARGECSADLMVPALLAACRSQSEGMMPAVASLGAITKLESGGRQRSGGFTGTKFTVSFEKGTQKWFARGGADGKLVGFWTESP